MTKTKKLRVAMLAPPWIKVPPKGYGGIEAVLDGLLPGLVNQGVDVELFTVGETNNDPPPGVKIRYLYKDEQYKYIHQPLFHNISILLAHMQFALNEIEKDGNFDIIHDHNGFIGPGTLAYATGYSNNLPPTIHTHHGPPFTNAEMLADGLPDNRPFWRQLAKIKNSRLYIVGISHTLMHRAPAGLRKMTLEPVYNAVNLDNCKFSAKKDDYFATLARFSAEKAQHIAIRLCEKKDYALKMAGTVAGMSSAEEVVLETANPLSRYRSFDDFKYFSDKILPATVRNKQIEFLGNVAGAAKQKLVSRARALLFPIQWEEPFGMAVIEAQASGTPVVAMRRGAMPEIIEHGRNGFLANNEREFAEYMERVDEIDPAECRRSVEERFTSDVMAREYIKRYKQVIAMDR